MKVEVRREPQSRAVLEVELPPEDVARAIDEAHRRLAQRVAIPGFRRGKAPRAIVERYVGRESLMDEALKLLLPDGYARAVREAGLAPVGNPDIDVTTELSDLSPLRFTAAVDVVPDVDAGDYRSIRITREDATVSESEIDGAIEDLRLRHATLASAGEEAAATGDFVLIQVLDAPAGLSRLQAGKEYLVEIGGGTFPEPVERGLGGIRKGEQRTVPLEGPEQQGVSVVALDVKRRELPPLDEAFTRQVGADSVEALRAQLRDRMKGEAERRAAEAHEEAVLQAVTAQAGVEPPRSMTAHEAEHLLEDFVGSLGRRGLTLETYLRASEKKEEDFRAELAALAERRLRTQLVLEEIARRESIAPTEEEIDHEVENLAQSLKQESARVREWLGEERRRDALVNSLRRRKTVQFLVSIASQSDHANSWRA